MKRRSLVLGGAGAALAAGGAAMLWRPNDMGAPHNAYFSKLNILLKRDGPGRPVMLLDMDRVNTNIDQIAGSVGIKKNLPGCCEVPSLCTVVRACDAARQDKFSYGVPPAILECNSRRIPSLRCTHWQANACVRREYILPKTWQQQI